MPASDPAANRSRWMREGRICMAACDWAGAIRAYGQGLLDQPLLGMHYAAGRAFTLAQLYQHLGHPVTLLGSHFPLWGRELWQPIRTAVEKAQLLVHSFVAEHEPRTVEQAFALVLQHPADLLHLSKPRLAVVVIGLLYQLLWGAAVLVELDDEELCNARELMGSLWTRLAVDLARRFDGITVANGPQQAG